MINILDAKNKRIEIHGNIPLEITEDKIVVGVPEAPVAPLDVFFKEFWKQKASEPWKTQPGVTLPTPQQTPCMFDGLPPGVYHLSCNCPRCTPHCYTAHINL